MENYYLFTTEICWYHLSIHLSNKSIMLLTQHATPVKTGLLQWDSKLLVAAMTKLNNLPSKHSSMHMASQSRCCTITSWTNTACRSITPCLKSTLQVSHNKALRTSGCMFITTGTSGECFKNRVCQESRRLSF